MRDDALTRSVLKVRKQGKGRQVSFGRGDTKGRKERWWGGGRSDERKGFDSFREKRWRSKVGFVLYDRAVRRDVTIEATPFDELEGSRKEKERWNKRSDLNTAPSLPIVPPQLQLQQEAQAPGMEIPSSPDLLEEIPCMRFVEVAEMKRQEGEVDLP